jgi:Family of unknown function (DUF6516)
MVGHIVATLRQSPLVRDLEIGAMIDEANVQLLRVRAELIDGSLLYVREAIFPHTSKYAYHWQTSTGEMLLRWDNAPHHPEIPTHPHHKHDGEQIGPTARVSIEDVLAELATRLQSKGEV